MSYNKVLNFWKNKNIRSSDELAAVLESYSVHFAYNSGNIENSEITYHDTREIFDKNGVTSYTGSTKTLFEIQNSKAAYEKILSLFDDKPHIDESMLKEFHKILTVGTYNERRFALGECPGEYKHRDYVTGKKEAGALAEDVSEEIDELLNELSDIDDENALTAAAYFHAKFENIHPFSDGNGRVGRLLMNYILLIHNHPPVIFFTEDKKDYYSALEEFDEKLDLKPLIEFIKFQTEKTWKNQISRENTDCSITDFIK